MARITKAEQAVMPDVSRLIPADLVAKLSQDELNDRVHCARANLAKAAAQTDPTLKRGYSQLAGAVLRTNEPRDEIERHYRDLVTKAALTHSSVISSQLMDAAQRYITEHPIAPRRNEAVRAQLTKAAADGQLGVWDKDGNLLGTCDPSKVTMLVSASDGAAAMEKDTAGGDSDAAAGLRRYLGTQPAAEKDTEDEASVDSAAAAARPLGTPGGPVSAAAPAGTDEVSKARRPSYNAVIKRGPR